MVNVRRGSRRSCSGLARAVELAELRPVVLQAGLDDASAPGGEAERLVEEDRGLVGQREDPGGHLAHTDAEQDEREPGHAEDQREHLAGPGDRRVIEVVREEAVAPVEERVDLLAADAESEEQAGRDPERDEQQAGDQAEHEGHDRDGDCHEDAGQRAEREGEGLADRIEHRLGDGLCLREEGQRHGDDDRPEEQGDEHDAHTFRGV